MKYETVTLNNECYREMKSVWGKMHKNKKGFESIHLHFIKVFHEVPLCIAHTHSFIFYFYSSLPSWFFFLLFFCSSLCSTHSWHSWIYVFSSFFYYFSWIYVYNLRKSMRKVEKHFIEVCCCWISPLKCTHICVRTLEIKKKYTKSSLDVMFLPGWNFIFIFFLHVCV